MTMQSNMTNAMNKVLTAQGEYNSVLFQALEAKDQEVMKLTQEREELKSLIEQYSEDLEKAEEQLQKTATHIDKKNERILQLEMELESSKTVKSKSKK